jgi:transketolase
MDAVPRADLGDAKKPMWARSVRQALPTLDRTRFAPTSGLARGGYVLAEGTRPSRPTWCRDGGIPDVILLAPGSAIHLALAAREQLHAYGISTRVVSMPCRELFDRQSQQYRDDVLPPSVTARVAVVQASTLGWDRYVGDDGAVVGMHTSAASTPHRQLLDKTGFTPERLARIAHDRLAAVRRR